MSRRLLSSIASAAVAAAVASCSSDPGPRREAPTTPRPETARADTDPPAATPGQRLSGRQTLPPLARDMLLDPMRTHGDNLESLLWTTLMLDYESTATIASWIAEEPRISRPRGTLDTLNTAFPPEFFALQEQLYGAAGDLSRAAKKRNDAAMADAFSRLAGTCVRCHSIYRRPPDRVPARWKEEP